VPYANDSAAVKIFGGLKTGAMRTGIPGLAAMASPDMDTSWGMSAGHRRAL
jgi:hypothetical protein